MHIEIYTPPGIKLPEPIPFGYITKAGWYIVTDTPSSSDYERMIGKPMFYAGKMRDAKDADRTAFYPGGNMGPHNKLCSPNITNNDYSARPLAPGEVILFVNDEAPNADA